MKKLLALLLALAMVCGILAGCGGTGDEDQGGELAPIKIGCIQDTSGGASVAGHKGPLIFYESPLRVSATCKDLSEMLGDRPAALVRELTKIYEECVRGTLSSLAERYRDNPPKGECVLIVSGAEDAPAATEEDIKTRLMQLLAKGVRAKDAAKEVSAVLGVSRNEAYKLAVELQNQ